MHILVGKRIAEAIKASWRGSYDDRCGALVAVLAVFGLAFDAAAGIIKLIFN